MSNRTELVLIVLSVVMSALSKMEFKLPKPQPIFHGTRQIKSVEPQSWMKRLPPVEENLDNSGR